MLSDDCLSGKPCEEFNGMILIGRLLEIAKGINITPKIQAQYFQEWRKTVKLTYSNDDNKGIIISEYQPNNREDVVKLIPKPVDQFQSPNPDQPTKPCTSCGAHKRQIKM